MGWVDLESDLAAEFLELEGQADLREEYRNKAGLRSDNDVARGFNAHAYKQTEQYRVYCREYINRPHVRARFLAYMKAYRKTPQYKARRAEYIQKYNRRPEVAAKRRAKEKAERASNPKPLRVSTATLPGSLEYQERKRISMWAHRWSRDCGVPVAVIVARYRAGMVCPIKWKQGRKKKHV